MKREGWRGRGEEGGWRGRGGEGGVKRGSRLTILINRQVVFNVVE